MKKPSLSSPVIAAADLRTTSLTEAVYEALRESIINTHEPPGSILTENAVAQRFGVARPTAKAALERLVAQGLLRRKAHRAAQVPTLTRADIEDLYATRMIIEEAIVGLLASRGVVPPHTLAAHRELQALTDSDESPPFARTDLNFHQALVAGYGSARLSRMHESILGEVQLCMGQLQANQLLRTKDIIGQHQGIIDAIESRDPELARFLIRRHIINARDRLLTRFLE